MYILSPIFIFVVQNTIIRYSRIVYKLFGIGTIYHNTRTQSTKWFLFGTHSFTPTKRTIMVAAIFISSIYMCLSSILPTVSTKWRHLYRVFKKALDSLTRDPLSDFPPNRFGYDKGQRLLVVFIKEIKHAIKAVIPKFSL